MDLHLIGQYKVDARLQVEAHAHASVLGADQRQRACLLDQLLDVFDAALALATGNEIAQAADDLAGAQRLFGGLVHGVANHADALVGAVLQQSARAFM